MSLQLLKENDFTSTRLQGNFTQIKMNQTEARFQ